MFLGEYQHTLDKKGRVSLPAKFRAETTGRLVISKGFDDCLWVFPADSYTLFLDRLVAEDDFRGNARKVRRHFMAGAVETELDSAGRITLPQVLRDHAGLEKDVAITGNGDRIEIWDSEKWAEYSAQTADSIEDFAEELADASLP
jgi:MraZ protein